MPSEARLRAAEWVVQGVPYHGEVIRFLRAEHYARGASNTSVYRHGLYEHGPSWPLVGELRGVALWIPPTKAAGVAVAGQPIGWQGVLCLSRLCVDPDVPRNGASFLLGRSMALIDRTRWPILLTYADAGQGHTGAIYRATNWTDDGERLAGDTWVDAAGRQWGIKRGSRTRTVVEMAAEGLTRGPKSPKRRFVHVER